MGPLGKSFEALQGSLGLAFGAALPFADPLEPDAFSLALTRAFPNSIRSLHVLETLSTFRSKKRSSHPNCLPFVETNGTLCMN